MSRKLGDIEEAVVLEETTLSDGNGFSWLARQADWFTSRNRGSWVTEGIILADYAKNKDRLREAYKDGKNEIDRYFDNVDVQKIVTDAGPDMRKRVKTGLLELVKNNVPGFVAGAVATAGTIIAINRFKQ
jgi:hypothetical protein